jgi:hypothetical protein
MRETAERLDASHRETSSTTYRLVGVGNALENVQDGRVALGGARVEDRRVAHCGCRGATGARVGDGGDVVAVVQWWLCNGGDVDDAM